MMNFVGAINGDEQTVEKIVAAQAHHKKIDGHAPDPSGATTSTPTSPPASTPTTSAMM